MHSAPGTHDFTLQAGPFGQKDEALRMYDRLKAANMKPVFAPVEQNGTTIWRIRLGRFADRAEAEAAARALLGRDGVSTTVVKH